MRAFDALWAAMFNAISSVVVAEIGFAAGFAATPPTAVPFYHSNTGTGERLSNITLDISIMIPANAYSGICSSTWTTTLVSGP